MPISLEKTSGLGRRSFIKGAGISAAAVAAAGLTSKAAFAQSPDLDEAIGQFALNLEYLEAEFYTMAVTGKTLSQSGFDLSGLGTPGTTTGGSKVDFSGDTTGKLQAIATEIMMDEQNHVKLIRGLLQSGVIAKPAINLDALGIGFASFQQFIQLARAFEDTGSSAYGGAANLITSKSYLETAVRINIIEGYHASLLRGLASFNNVSTSALDSQDILPPPSGTQYFPTDSQGLATVRTTSEVLAIVYANSTPGTPTGGFFPNGVNGTIRTV